MRFTPDKCPECGEQALGTLETVPGLALLVFDDNGDAEGETKIDWDSQVSQRDEAGRVLLECSEGHQWPAERSD
jgi:hypothetical protein